jgi:hypothetical protein
VGGGVRPPPGRAAGAPPPLRGNREDCPYE